VRTIGIVFGGLLLLPFWVIASIILGEDVFEWIERRHRKRDAAKGGGDAE
jgi:hypothetical protein